MDNYDTATVDAYMSAVRNEYYGANNMPSIQRKNAAVPQRPVVKPPFVESAGASTQPPGNPTTQIDYSKLSRLSNDEQAQLIAQLGYFSK